MFRDSLLQRSRLFAIGLLGIAAAGLIACSSDDGDDPTPTAPAAVTSPEATPDPYDSPPPAGSPTTGASVAVSVAESDLGSFLTDSDGRSLYVFLMDAPDTSNCTGGCLDNWPPLLVEDGATVESDPALTGAFSSIETPSGEQVTYNGAPLYYFAADTAAGDTNGHLVGDVWFLARPDSASTAVLGVHTVGFLVGPTGMTVYTFANDSAGVSNCSGSCLENWPALTVPDGVEATAAAGAAGEVGEITRDDGTRQLTYNGLPLYYFVGDALPGETNGDGVGGVWATATP